MKRFAMSATLVLVVCSGSSWADGPAPAKVTGRTADSLTPWVVVEPCGPCPEPVRNGPRYKFFCFEEEETVVVQCPVIVQSREKVIVPGPYRCETVKQEVTRWVPVTTQQTTFKQVRERVSRTVDVPKTTMVKQVSTWTEEVDVVRKRRYIACEPLCLFPNIRIPRIKHEETVETKCVTKQDIQYVPVTKMVPKKVTDYVIKEVPVTTYRRDCVPVVTVEEVTRMVPTTVELNVAVNRVAYELRKVTRVRQVGMWLPVGPDDKPLKQRGEQLPVPQPLPPR